MDAREHAGDFALSRMRPYRRRADSAPAVPRRQDAAPSGTHGRVQPAVRAGTWAKLIIARRVMIHYADSKCGRTDVTAGQTDNHCPERS